jgi:two-component system sensor histidine kinase KdpD
MPAVLHVRHQSVLAGLVFSLGSVLAATLIAYALQRIGGVERVSGVYFVAVVISASAFGLWNGVLAAVMATAAYNFVCEGGFVASLGDKQDIVNLILFCTGAWVVSLYVDEARRAREALKRLASAELEADTPPLLARIIDLAFFRWRALDEILRVLAAVFLSAASAGLGTLLALSGSPQLVAMVYLAGVVLAASLLGTRYALITAILNVIGYDYFNAVPRFTFTLDSATAGINLIIFLAVGWQVGRFTEQVRYERQAVRRLFEAGDSFSATADELTLRRLIAEAVSGVTGGRWAGVRDETGLLAAQSGQKPLTSAKLQSMRLVCEGRDLGEVSWSARARDDDRPTERTVAVLLELGAAAIARARISQDNARLEAVAQAEELRRALLASISHDFRTPLVGVLGSVTSLVDLYDQYDDAVRKDLLQNIREQAFRLSRYVENLLGMARVESQSLQPKPRPVPLEAFVYETWESLMDGTRAAIPEVAVDEAIWVAADPLLLRQALSNVLQNAIKYTPPDKTVQVSAAVDGDRVRLDVSDFGPGARGDLEDLFKPFFRARNSKAGGVGLGLFIARSFLEVMGGTITAKRRGGGETGMIFEFTLPKAEVSP